MGVVLAKIIFVVILFFEVVLVSSPILYVLYVTKKVNKQELRKICNFIANKDHSNKK